MAERGIGRGLSAILPATRAGDADFHEIPVELIRPNPRQPRGTVREDSLAELAESVKVHGLLQPVLVRPLSGSGYELIAGERRWRAARLAGFERVPALVRSSQESDRLELALIENMAREDLNPIDAAQACAALVEELGLTKEEVGRRVGRSRVAISNLIRLLDLPDDVLDMVARGELTEGHGRALLQASEPRAQRTLAREVRDRALSVRETEAKARSSSDPTKLGVQGARSVRADEEAARLEAEEALSAALGAEAHVRLTRNGGRIEIPFESLSDVYDLVRRLDARRLAA